jgi:hypothetical protein
MPSSYIQVGPTAGQYASLTVNVDPATGLPVVGAGGGGTSATVLNENLYSVATVTPVASATTSATVLASNPLRKGARLVNNSNSMFFGLYGTGTASATNYSFVLAPVTAAPLTPVGIPSYEEIPSGYVGPIVGVWASANGNLLITEFV